MLQPVNPQDGLAIGRLLELLAPPNSGTPWHRSLWNIGLVLGLFELHEACVAARLGTLSDEAVKRVCRHLARKAGKDPALSKEERNFVQAQTNQVPRADGASHHSVKAFARLLQRDYVKRWGRVVATVPTYSAEGFARAVAAHMLDSGFSSAHIHAFIKDRLDAAAPCSLEALCEELDAEAQANAPRNFDVLLAFSKPPRVYGGTPLHWLKAHGVSGWLKENGFDTTDIRAAVGFTVNVQARDLHGAALAARNRLDGFAARALIATGDRLQPLPYLWVRGASERFPLNNDSRGVRVKALYRGGFVFEGSSFETVDAAVELLAHLDGSSPAAAIAGGWGAIEGLLADPNNRSAAADNFAALVACSLPRAELTVLSYTAEEEHPAIEAQLASCESNRERSRVMAELIRDGALPALAGFSDAAAVARIQQLLQNPAHELADIKGAVAEAFHRLYRQRNLILHGAQINSVSLTASLRTVAKLAGAGMDRIIHGQYVQGLRPLELVARADLSMALVAGDSSLACVDLLEPA